MNKMIEYQQNKKDFIESLNETQIKKLKAKEAKIRYTGRFGGIYTFNLFYKEGK